MRKITSNLILLNCFFVGSLIVSNIVAGKVVDIWGLTVPAAIVAYPITYLCTDIIGELWGKQEANRTVKFGVIVQIFSLILIYLAIFLPAADFAVEYQAAFKETLCTSGRFVAASLCAYLVSQLCDVTIFHKLRDKTNGRHKWLRNNVGTMTSQLLDTAIFITIGFWGTVPDLPLMVVSQYIVKFFLALLDTPFFYFFTRKRKDVPSEAA